MSIIKIPAFASMLTSNILHWQDVPCCLVSMRKQSSSPSQDRSLRWLTFAIFINLKSCSLTVLHYLLISNIFCAHQSHIRHQRVHDDNIPLEPNLRTLPSLLPLLRSKYLSAPAPDSFRLQLVSSCFASRTKRKISTNTYLRLTSLLRVSICKLHIRQATS